MVGKIFIYCDEPAHPRRVAVTNFVPLPGGGWHEIPATRGREDNAASGHTLIGDHLAPTGWALDPAVDNAEIRDHHELVCRKCRRQPLRLLPETLDALLDGWRHAGVPEVSMRLLAASIGRVSES